MDFDIPEHLEKSILKGLTVHLKGRFQSAVQFRKVIEFQWVMPDTAPAAPTVPAENRTQVVLFAGIAAAVRLLTAGAGCFAGGSTGVSKEDGVFPNSLGGRDLLAFRS